jgi:hypothetical protein
MAKNKFQKKKKKKGIFFVSSSNHMCTRVQSSSLWKQWTLSTICLSSKTKEKTAPGFPLGAGFLVCFQLLLFYSRYARLHIIIGEMVVTD